MIINEAEERHVSAPPGFPICQHFHYDPNVDIHYAKKGLYNSFIFFSNENALLALC